jgi:preprotein translocase subunit SecB
MDQTKDPGLKIAQIFLLQAQFSHREDVLTLPYNHPVGELNLELETKMGTNPEGTGGIVTVTVRTRDEDNPIYRFAIEMAALIEEDPATKNMKPEAYLATSGGALLYPFVREIVASLTWKGRFGPIWLKPVNMTLGTTRETVIDAVSGGRKPER